VPSVSITVFSSPGAPAPWDGARPIQALQAQTTRNPFGIHACETPLMLSPLETLLTEPHLRNPFRMHACRNGVGGVGTPPLNSELSTLNSPQEQHQRFQAITHSHAFPKNPTRAVSVVYALRGGGGARGVQTGRIPDRPWDRHSCLSSSPTSTRRSPPEGRPAPFGFAQDERDPE
jgi:hypothetical protein